MGVVCHDQARNRRVDARMTINSLWQFRKWLTIAEAAEVLSASMPRSQISDADVLRLALDGDLKLSVQLPGTSADCYERGKTDGPMQPAHIEGVWDLPMVGPGRRQVEQVHNNIRGFPFIS